MILLDFSSDVCYHIIDMAQIRKAIHDEVPPLINEQSKVLILGSMLSPKSAQAKFYYAHPQNRFWRVLFALFDGEYTTDIDRRAQFALSHGIALWDVIYSCDIVGASDSTIKNVIYNDIDGLLNRYENITRVYTTGGTAYKHLQRYNKQFSNKVISDATALPSTSPQNCKVTLTELIKAYSIITETPV